ncbi:MAG: hypothetical protein B1H02_00785 [Candidatus Latescibacteria bacterium 4484_107]|nr:MAG: hypothetical protein B1H02_00785 [Candidatus Latescibacteria bacterium 4484_107]
MNTHRGDAERAEENREGRRAGISGPLLQKEKPGFFRKAWFFSLVFLFLVSVLRGFTFRARVPLVSIRIRL